MKSLTELTQKQYDKVLDVFRVRCFHVAYMTLHDILDNTTRFAEAVSMTSDIVLDIAKPEIRDSFHKWYYTYYGRRKWGGRRGLVS